jgi:hypothetical protein
MYFTVQTAHFNMLNKMKHLIVTALFLFASHICLSQFNGDSLKKAILLMPDDAASIYKIIEIGLNARKGDYTLALDIFRIAEKKYGEKKNRFFKRYHLYQHGPRNFLARKFF